MNSKARLKRLESRANIKSDPDMLWRQYSKLSDKVNGRIKARFSPEDKEKYDYWLAGFCWDGFDNDDDWKIKDELYAKYADSEDLKALKQLENMNRQYKIDTCTREGIKRSWPWIDDAKVENLYTLTKAGNFDEVAAIHSEMWENMTEEQADALLAK